MLFINTHGRAKYDTKSPFCYDEENDIYFCPAGRRIAFVRIQKDKMKQSPELCRGNCFWCPIRQNGTKSSSGTIKQHPKEARKDVI